METALLLVEAIPQKLDAIVQLVRNGLCCVKDLQLGPGYIHDPSVTAKYYRFPEPLDQTTPLEIAICLCQFFAFVSVSKSGYGLMTKSGWFKLKRVQRLVQVRASSSDDGKNATSAATSTSDDAINRIIDESLEKERADANRCIFVGANVLVIGLSFFWLVCNSLHITQTNWVGGLQALIHALTVMEIGLAPLLYYMLKDGAAHLVRSASILQFRDKLSKALDDKKKNSAEQLLGYETYCWIREGGWSPFWEKPAASPRAGKKTQMEENVGLYREMKQVRVFVEGLTHGDRRTASVKTIVAEAKGACEDGRLDELSVETRWHGYFEYIYFVLNFIAFYGYMLGVLTYYFDDDYLEGTYTGSLRFGYNNASADWGGNFAGDAMWTVEPIFILSTPMLLGWVQPKKAAGVKAKVE
mmetsp:Transcript_14989/g.35797  ORF Transcript_14989/g.35797 Transcript_14989/m.35797 type:complete len:413 (-) Transcript_14989:225-1463(-)